MLKASGDLLGLRVSLAGNPVTVLHHRKRRFTIDGWDYTIDLPEELEVATQVFLMWVVLHGWGRPGD